MTMTGYVEPGKRYIVLRTALQRFEKTPGELTDEQLDEVRQQADEEYHLQSRVLSSNEARDLILPESAVDKALREIASRYADHDEFLQDLTDNDVEMEDLRKALFREVKVDAVLDRVASRAASISDLDVMIYYYMHPERFTQPATRTARHILITINQDFPENTRERALARIEAVASRVKKKPQRFAEQATKHSECPTAMQGGLLGRLPRGQLYPELDEVLFTLGTGEVSDVVESPIGFHVLLCEVAQEAGPVSLAQARPKIRELLEKRRRRMCQRNWLADLPLPDVTA